MVPTSILEDPRLDKEFHLEIRSGQLIIDDPQRRCYDGAFFKYHIEWEEWRPWYVTYTTLKDAELAIRLFQRDTQQLRIAVPAVDAAT